jgi:hypothetical protein
VYLNALLASVFSSIYEISIFLVLSYWAILLLLLRTERVNSAIIFLPFCGLMPYLFVPTKEAFLFLGILLGILAYLDRRFLAFGLFGIALIYLARPQAFYIGLIAIFICYLSKYRKAFVCFLIIAIAVYWYRLREGILFVAEFEQHVALMADNGFCHVGPLPVCVDSSGKPELIFAVRLLTLLGLPLKWAWQGVAALWEGLPLGTAIIRVALVVQLAWVYLVFSRLGPVDRRAMAVRRGMAYFAGLYFMIYGMLIYFQSTRQVAVATTILVIGFCVTSAGPKGAKAVVGVRQSEYPGPRGPQKRRRFATWNKEKISSH